MNRVNIELDIANIIKAIAFYDITIQNMKYKLGENPNFDILEAWHSLNRSDDDYVENEDFQIFFAQNRIPASEREIEWLINQNKEVRGKLDFEGFLRLILPRDDDELRQQLLYKNQGGKKQSIQYFNIESVMRNFSEKEIANIFSKELEGYREVESLKQQFLSYNLSVNEIYQIVNFQNSTYVNEDSLIGFMKKVNVQFSLDECQAFLRRTTLDNDMKLDYQELVNTLMPYDPYEFMPYRKDFNIEQTTRHLSEKMREFQLDPQAIQGQVQINQELREVEQDPKDYNYPLQKVFDVYQHMNKCYFYDSGYMGQLKEYKNLYYDPNKSKQFLYSQNKKTGVRYHDNFYEDFYKYLHENDVNELFFNKFGKKYAYDEDFKKIKTEMQFNPKIAPAHLDSTLKYQQTLKLKTELQKTKQQIPYKQQ